jgi:uncharacterized membrane protein YeaQ/YmgE (transglycosylase-associated protein family)
MRLLFWVLEGVIARWLMGQIMVRQKRDYVMDIGMGVAAGVGGGFLLSITDLPVRGAMTSLAAVWPPSL